MRRHKPTSLKVPRKALEGQDLPGAIVEVPRRIRDFKGADPKGWLKE